MLILLVDVPLVDPILHVCHGAHVEGRVGQGPVDHRQPEVGEEGVEQGDDHQVPVVGRALAQPATTAIHTATLDP